VSLSVSETEARAGVRSVGSRHAVDWAPVVVALLTVSVFVVRLAQMHQSLYGDEVLALHEIVGHTLLGTVRAVRGGAESSPPLFFVLAWISAKLGDPTVLIRLPSLAFGTATIPVVYLLGRETVGRAAGVLGAAMLAMSPFALYYGVEARPYATLAFLSALSTLALVLAVRKRQRRWWLLYAFAAAAAAYTHYTAVFVLATQGAWSLWACRDRPREPVLANLLAVVLFLPWLPSVHGSQLGLYGLLEPLTAGHVLRDLAQPIVGYPYAPLGAIPTIPGLSLIGAFAVAGLVALLVDHRAQLSADLRDSFSRADGRWLITLLALATPVGLLLYSSQVTDIWGSRSLYASAPTGVILLAGLLLAIPQKARAVAVVITLGALVFGTIRAISPRYARPQFREVAEIIDRDPRPGDPVVMYPAFLNLTQAIPAQFARSHPVIWGVPTRWPSVPSGGTMYVVYDNAVGRVHHLPVPSPPHFTLVAWRRYDDLITFTLLEYRAS
jgi:Dolichyl-phosphate-mannose-protein mannosyltransferase